jgi:outer membrane protein assembly factor BamB
MTIKIQCPCGSKYSFEVDPVEGRMPFAVQCPTCGADGTELANLLIAEMGGKPKLHIHQTAPIATETEPPPRPYAPALGSAMERLHQERRQFRAIGWIASAVALVLVALLGAWGWFVVVGSKPRLSYAVKVPGAEASWRTEFVGPGVILMVSPDHATAHDLNAGKDLWSVSLSEKESGEGARPPTYIDKDSVWICLGDRVLRLNRATGEMKQTIPITGQFQSFTPSDTSLLVVSAKNETTRLACRIDLASGEVATDEITVPRAEKRAMPNELPPNVQPTAGLLLAQALDEQKFNKPLDAMSSEFFSTGANLVELRVKLLEPKVMFVQTIKPRGPTHINSSLTASSSSADVAEEVFNDIKRDQTGGVKGIDESRYEATLRRWLGGAGPAEWKGEVTGVPMFFSLKTVDLLVAGKQITVFDKQNKKLFDTPLLNAINGRYSPDRWDRRSVPGVEGPGGLYFFDEGALTAFSLPSGAVRWRLPSVGISKAQFDDHGVLYVDSTAASPDDIQYSDQIKLDQTAPVLLKIDPSSGKILWQAAQEGQSCFLSGPFLYTASAQQGGIALANGLAEALNAPRPDAPVYFHIYRLDPVDGRILWDFYREQAPSEFSFQQNRFLTRFGPDVQVWKFLTF